MLDVQDRAKLTWHCRRGMLELDLILQHFMENGVDALNPSQLAVFDSLLGNTDPELYSWLMGHREPPEEWTSIVAFIRNCH